MSERKEPKPLSEMSLCELIQEKQFREAVRYAYDRDDHKMHRSLALHVDIINRRIKALLSDKEEDGKD
ncbi:hypothetical protein GF369_04490 [Candidatus Peregrinibacteria bacterium]|nr:hypothetical protein [Candidatus Peregrinibacteria bacterium]